jgi:hypothetical protein
MNKLFCSMLACALTLGLALGQASAQEPGDAGTGADAVEPQADMMGTPETTSDAAGHDQSGFDPGWIGLAGLLGLAGLMGRDRVHHHDHTTATGTHTTGGH